MASNPSSGKPFLNGPDSLDNWVWYVVNLGKGGNNPVNDYVDPTKSTPIPEAPVEPTIYSAGCPEDKDYATTTQEIRTNYHRLWEIWKYQKSDHKATLNRLQEINITIDSTINPKYFIWIKEANTPREKIKALQDRLQPDDRTKKLELAAKYNLLKGNNPNNQAIETLIDDWELIYPKCKAENIPEVAGENAQYDFLRVITQLYREYGTTQEANLDRVAREKGAIPSLQELLNDFRAYHRRQVAYKQVASSLSFATLKGEPQPEQQRSNQSKPGTNNRDRPYTCLCGNPNHTKDDRFFYLKCGK